jgi:hypothetical protein
MPDGVVVNVHGITAEVSAAADASFSVDIWHWFSLDQAIAATVFSQKCGRLESNPRTPTAADRASGLTWSPEDQRDHRSYVIASILSSVGFLEASINEVFASASFDNLEVGGRLSADERGRLTEAADMIANNRLLDRFRLTLLLLGKASFDIGAEPYQDAATLVNLRNELVHYKPQFRTGSAGSREESKWIKGLQGKGFSVNPFTGTANPFFPDKCLSHGCTVWAWNAALTFSDEFFQRLGVTPVYANQRSSLAF